MYKCLACGRTFASIRKYPDFSGEYWGVPFVKNYGGCPYCRSDDVSEIVYYCDCCNFGLTEDDVYYVTKDGRVFCEECISKQGGLNEI